MKAASGEAGRMGVPLVRRKWSLQPESSSLLAQVNQNVLHVDHESCERFFVCLFVFLGS